MSRTRRPYLSDLSDEEWGPLEPLPWASPEKRGRPPKWPPRRVAEAVFHLLGSTCSGAGALGEWRPGSTLPGGWCITTSGSGAGTEGSGGSTTGFARRRVAPGTRAGRDLAGALRSGEVRVEGDESAVERFLGLFPLQEPAAPAAQA